LRALAFPIGLVFFTLGHAQWERTAFPIGGDVPALLAAGSDLYAASRGGGVYRSPDNGLTWTALDSGLADKYVNCLAYSGSALFAGTPSGVFASSDRGASWAARDSGLPRNPVIRCLALSGSDLFAGTEASGIFRSSDQGRSWARMDSTSPAYSLRAFLVTGAGLFAAAANGVYRSTDSGRHWMEVNTGLDDRYVESLAAMGPRLFAGTEGGVFVSMDMGEHWTKSNAGLNPTYHDAASLLVVGSDLFAGTTLGVYRSANNGADWTESSSGFQKLDFILALAANGEYMFASVTTSTTDNGVWRLRIPATGIVPRLRGIPARRSSAWFFRQGARFTVGGRKLAG
jgi:photosystem II stability/assembly factor-like uncharacterized protein